LGLLMSFTGTFGRCSCSSVIDTAHALAVVADDCDW
jgi:hypothetical protein